MTNERINTILENFKKISQTISMWGESITVTFNIKPQDESMLACYYITLECSQYDEKKYVVTYPKNKGEESHTFDTLDEAIKYILVYYEYKDKNMSEWDIFNADVNKLYQELINERDSGGIDIFYM